MSRVDIRWKSNVIFIRFVFQSVVSQRRVWCKLWISINKLKHIKRKNQFNASFKPLLKYDFNRHWNKFQSTFIRQTKSWQNWWLKYSFSAYTPSLPSFIWGEIYETNVMFHRMWGVVRNAENFARKMLIEHWGKGKAYENKQNVFRAHRCGTLMKISWYSKTITFGLNRLYAVSCWANGKGLNVFCQTNGIRSFCRRAENRI